VIEVSSDTRENDQVTHQGAKTHIDTLNENSPPPVLADAQGRYAPPIPGAWQEI
jgi:hypothetical protein